MFKKDYYMKDLMIKNVKCKYDMNLKFSKSKENYKVE